MTSTTENATADAVGGEPATYDPSGGTQGVVVGQHVQQFVDFAKTLAVSDLLPDGLRGKPGNVFMAMMQGLDLGLRPMQALNLIDVIKGKPAMNAQGMRALITAAGHELDITEWTDTKCVIRGRRKEWGGEWREASFTIEQSKNAGLGGDNWKKYPADMLLARATSRLAKAYFADVTNGLSSVEELLDVAQVARPSLGEVAAARETQAADVGADGDPIVDATVIDEPSDDEIRQAVLDLGAQETTCPACGEIPAHAPSACPNNGIDALDTPDATD